MIPVPSGVRVWLAVGRTDMRKGMNGLALQVQEALGRDPHAGDLYVFRGARGGLIKSSGTMGSACRSTRSGWNMADSFGRRRPTERLRSRPRS
jgi:transposase